MMLASTSVLVVAQILEGGGQPHSHLEGTVMMDVDSSQNLFLLLMA